MRKLTVKKERLAELTTDELARVAGAAPDAVPTTPLKECLQNIGTLHRCTTAMTCPRPDTD